MSGIVEGNLNALYKIHKDLRRLSKSDRMLTKALEDQEEAIQQRGAAEKEAELLRAMLEVEKTASVEWQQKVSGAECKVAGTELDCHINTQFSALQAKHNVPIEIFNDDDDDDKIQEIAPPAVSQAASSSKRRRMN